ncbi:hypothetical protein V6N12_039884 [Hibiscus sabdariffa]|uniref:Major facilitator superfamily (MFS) profile domain-containing protein n=1 Tax=Hibiscus sabdariffa TaxID=183260 RepID=A0ABR2E233_9ROSI
MAWFSGKFSLGGFPDLAGAVNKLQESVKNIEKNFDNENSESNSNEEAESLEQIKSDEAAIELLREEYHQRVSTLERRKLRAQIRELEEEKKGLTTKLQVEENKVESIKKDKTATEKLLQETVDKHQVELATQKDFYTNALNAAREAEALAEARANNEARTELESHLREAEERESMLVQTLEELRQTLSRKEQQAVFGEDMLCRDIEDLQKRYQASERRCEEFITKVPESTRPLLRQIEAMQLEELRADIVDLKEMYREKVNLLVNKLKSESFVFSSGESVYSNVEMRGRHADSYSMYKRGSRDQIINAYDYDNDYDYDKEQVRLLNGVGKDIGNPPWKRSFPYILLATLSSFLFGYHLGVVNETLESISYDLGFHGDTMAEDGIGRRRAFQLCALPMIIGSSMCATAKNFWGMLLGRLFVGTGMGIGPPVAALYMAEVSPAYIRGTYGSCSQMATCLGLMSALFMGFPAKETEGWWRICFWAPVAPAAILVLFMGFSVESPHWLFKRGRGADAEVVFEKLLGGPHAKVAMAELSKSERGDESDTVKLSEPLYGRHRKVVFIGSLLFALQQLSGINAVFYFSSTVFKSAGVPSESANICVGIANLLGSLFAFLSMDKLGRKALLVASFSGMAAAMGIQATSASSLVSSSNVIYISVGGMLLFVFAFAMGAGPVPGLLLSEMFPGRIRAKAMSICMAVHWVFNFLVGLLFLRLLELLGPLLLNTIFATFCPLAVIFVKKNVLETKGKTLQEIEVALLPPVLYYVGTFIFFLRRDFTTGFCQSPQLNWGPYCYSVKVVHCSRFFCIKLISEHKSKDTGFAKRCRGEIKDVHQVITLQRPMYSFLLFLLVEYRAEYIFLLEISM